MNTLFQTNPLTCVLCHSTAAKLGSLDLQSPGYTDRLKNQPAQHMGITPAPPAGACPTGDKLIDTATPANSWLLKKIENQQGMCGTVMPQTGTLTADQKTCLETYVACVAGGSITGGGGSGAGGTAAGGSGGAATGGAGAASGGGGSGGAATGGTGGTGGGGGTGGT